ncbi:MAG: carbohydrate ABC transporter substrate-binding protein [Spirochaetales bacterium]|nr:carbohydrate ABC transporter substrate-binding protein [Spirochaetales bacterium]
MKNKKSCKSGSILFILILICAGLFIMCTDKGAKPVTISFANWDQNSYEYFTNIKPLKEAYKEVKPNVTIEIENISSSEEYEKTLKIRNSGNELPDVFPLKPYMLANLKDSVLDLSDLDACKNNKFAGGHAIGGKVVGIPLTSFYEFVYYQKDKFSELGLAIPQTWDEFVDGAIKIKQDGSYIPIVMAGKDAWPDYPYNEFMPLLEAQDGNYWNVMATIDEPFSKDLPFYKSYVKIKKLYDAHVFGDDPLGLTFDQCRQLYAAGKGVMIAVGQWYQPTYETDGGDINDLGVFFLPARDNRSDPFVVTTMADMFIAIAENSKHREEAKAFVEWFFTGYYPDFIAWLKQGPTMEGIEADDPLLKQAFDNIEGTIKFTVIQPDGEAFAKIKEAVQFDVKRMGQEMMAGADLDQMMEDLNKKWKEALSR